MGSPIGRDQGRSPPPIDPSPTPLLEAAESAADACRHCGLPLTGGERVGSRFCCAGCEAAHALIRSLDLGSYYRRRVIDPEARPLRPDEDDRAIDYAALVQASGNQRSLHLMVDGLQCAACVWLIESVLAKTPGVTWARVNMSTRRLVIRWRAGEADPDDLVRRVSALGYRLTAYDPSQLAAVTSTEERWLLRSLAVAGFAAGNIMLLSIAVWSGTDMGAATRSLMHWVSALIALPAVVYAGRPFFGPAIAALRHGRLNMDVPISLAVVLATATSLWETVAGGHHVYFDSATALLFFLLIGRYLDSRARGRARSAAEHLIALTRQSITVLRPDGSQERMASERIDPGMSALVACGERIGADGRIVDGSGDVDTSLINGESLPTTVRPGDMVFAGMVNLGAPLRVTVTASDQDTLLAEIVRTMEAAEQRQAGYVRLADRVARLYAPGVHLLALATFAGWIALGHADWQSALLIAVAVLVITCPCALALAIPAVQVMASARLLRQGVLLKSATALEHLAAIDTVAFDKTGTLTEGRLELIDPDRYAQADLRLAASMALASRHPLSRALVRAVPVAAVAHGIREWPGRGLSMETPNGEIRLGNRAFCEVNDVASRGGPEVWLRKPGAPPVRFAFADRLRRDAVSVIDDLQQRELSILLLSGDRRAAVERIARRLDIGRWMADCDPVDKVDVIETRRRNGHHVLMVGDGLNDAPSLAAADVSMSPSSAADISQTAADIVFQGIRLRPVVDTIDIARRAHRLVRQNLAFAFCYNAVTIPLAVAGQVTPLVAAIAMSSSSLIVIGNAFRLRRRGGQ